MKQLNSILIIDDNSDDNYIHSRIITKTKIVEPQNILIKEDGEDAYDFFTQYAENREKDPGRFPPDLILLDINMPRMGGFEFLEKYTELKEKWDLSSVVVILVTTSQADQDRKKAQDFSCVKDYMVKPLTKEYILNVYEKHFT